MTPQQVRLKPSAAKGLGPWRRYQKKVLISKTATLAIELAAKRPVKEQGA